MSKTVVEVVYGKYAKYEIVKNSGTFSTSISLYKDGKIVSSFSSVEAAVEATKKRG